MADLLQSGTLTAEQENEVMASMQRQISQSIQCSLQRNQSTLVQQEAMAAQLKLKQRLYLTALPFRNAAHMVLHQHQVSLRAVLRSQNCELDEQW